MVQCRAKMREYGYDYKKMPRKIFNCCMIQDGGSLIPDGDLRVLTYAFDCS